VHERTLSAQDLVAGAATVISVAVPAALLQPSVEDAANGDDAANGGRAAIGGVVRVRPLTVGTLTLISRAAREDPGLVPVLTIKESVVEPELSLEHIRRMSVGLVHFLVTRINLLSGLSADGEAIDAALESPPGRVQFLLARHFGWTPQQVSALTPGQVAVYLAGIERLLAREEPAR
jgi:hypothetical protein